MIRRLLRLWPHRGILVRLGLLHVTLSVLQGLLLALLVPVLHALVAGPPDLAAARPWLITGAIGTLVYWALTVHATPVGFAASMRLTADARRRLMEHVTTLPLGWFGSANKARLTRTVVTATGDLGRLVAQLGPQAVSATVVPATLVVVIGLLDWRLGIVFLVTAPLAVLALRRSGRIAAETDTEMDRAATEVSGRAVELGQAQHVLRAAGQGASGGARLREALDEHRAGYRRALRRSLLPGLGYVGVVMAAFVVVLALGARFLLDGSLAAPDAVALLVLSVRYLESLGSLGGLVGGIRAIENALVRVETLLATPALPRPARPVRELAHSGIEFDGVTFAYGAPGEGTGGEGTGGAAQDARPALCDVSFQCPPGSTTALVGPSGSGKTTVTRLVARFHDVDAGSVRVGGTDVRDLDHDTLMRSLAIVFQDVHLFDGTIEENVRMARPGATDAEFAAAARAACLDEVIARLPDGPHSRVGEGGALLSGGERQRVSIARAFLKQARIVLLDEASSALDPENEGAVQRAVANLCADPDRTVVVIAHRPATLAAADRVIALDGGRVVESGPMDELLRGDGVFARLWRGYEEARGWRVATHG
ncbi:ABC transporter ATP-binding protein [Streptomyces caatingaensis]|uniref:ABC transporter n=1 Tax=Streptomyces caatingaensis TaxID=1678637 RepID=A0A0K9XAV2_9ACTN|nr:ABC transporter ATP-binding protein [Streptomyces caatingaensis]KNB50550.1 ABC transporter [Streptomyces caatingaensis]